MSDEMRTELTAFRDEVRSEMGGFRVEMTGFRAEMTGFRAEMLELRGDLRAMGERMETGFRELGAAIGRIAHVVERTDWRLGQLEQYAHEKLVTRGEFLERMDAYAGRLTDAKLHWAHQKERTDDHDRRLTKLEERPH